MERNQRVGHRRFQRLPASFPVAARAIQFGGHEFPGTVRNISGGGLMAEFLVKVVPGSTVNLVLQTGRGPLALTGQVVWTDSPGERNRHGIAFLEPRGHEFAISLGSTGPA